MAETCVGLSSAELHPSCLLPLPPLLLLPRFYVLWQLRRGRLQRDAHKPVSLQAMRMQHGVVDSSHLPWRSGTAIATGTSGVPGPVNPPLARSDSQLRLQLLAKAYEQFQ
jgi:hypothetical protein